MKPAHRLIHTGHDLARRQSRPRDHDHRQAKRPRRRQLGHGPRATGILGHQPCDTVADQQGTVASLGKRPARDLDRAIRQRQRIRRIDEAQQIMMLGPRREGGEVLAPDSKKDTRRGYGQRGNSGWQVGNLGPEIARNRQPSRALQRQQRHTGAGTGGNGILADPGGERMRRIDDPTDPGRAQILRQPLGPAKAPYPHRHGLRTGAGGAPGEGVNRGQPGPGHRQGKAVAFGRATKDEGRAHG